MSKIEITITDEVSSTIRKLEFEADDVSVKSIDPVSTSTSTDDIENELKAIIAVREVAEMQRSISAFNTDISKKEGRKFETKNLPFEIKEINADGSFSGYGSVFDVVDSYNDVVHSGAFKKTLKERKNVKLLWQHDSREPIGIFTEIFEDASGLVVKGQLAMDVQRAREAHSLIKMGAIDGLSIGYSTITSDFDDKSGIRNLKELKLYEVSVVTFPSNEVATISTVKSELPDGINNFIKSLQSRVEPIDIHAAAPVVEHSTDIEAEKTTDVKALDNFIKSLNKRK